MNYGLPPIIIQDKTDESINVPPFTSVYLALNVHRKPIPVHFRVVRDDFKNIQQTGGHIDDLDLELHYSFANNQPSNMNYDGKCFDKKMYFEVKSYGLEKFVRKNIHFGLYSKSGINVQIGCSFKVDYYQAG